MKGYRFYQVVTDKDKANEKRCQECVAIMPDIKHIGWCGDHYDMLYAGTGALYPDANNSPCIGGEIAQRYLTEHTRWVGEATARKVHPALFEYLEG